MPEVKWIKITTDMFEDEKIKLIEKMPDADTLLILWVKLICQAGKLNDGGVIYLSPDIPYNDEDLAAIFNRPVNVVRLALATFKRLEMITIKDNGHIFLLNWEKHQNIGALEAIRENTRKRVAAFRAGQRLLTSGNVTVTCGNKTEGEGEGEGRGEKERESKSIPSPSIVIFEKNFEDAWGRKPDSREIAYLKDIVIETNLKEVTEKQIHDAFREAVRANKLYLSYVRAILFSWLGIQKKGADK